MVEQITELGLQIIAIVVMAMSTAIAKTVADAYRAKMATLKASEKNTMLHDTIYRIVTAVEQSLSGSEGAMKLAAATELATKYLNKHNINLDTDEVRALIEAAVYGMKQGMKHEPA
jgi:hypothetical protein